VKLLLAIQYWKDDMAQAMKLARLIADLQPSRCEMADFLFVSRFDCGHDVDTEKYVSRKFNVYSFVNKRRGTGWPHGCNDLWFGTIDWIYGMREAKRIPNYKAVFTFEADGAPLVPHWIPVLSNAWDVAQKLAKVYVLGAHLQFPGSHINGNGLFSCDHEFIYWLARKKCAASPHCGWDYEMAPEFQKWGWQNCPAIKSYWRCSSFNREQFDKEVSLGVAYLHGVKDSSLLDICRSKYNLPPV